MELITSSIGLIIWALFSFCCLLLWVFALIDILRNEFKGQNEKLIWVLIIIFVPLLGAILYFVIGRKNRIKLNRY
jgi:hypothetical protein